MSPERSSKNQELINFVREEEKRIEAGEQIQQTPIKELARLFGYHPRSGHLSQTLKRAGINTEARRGTKEKATHIPTPSWELAYFIGLLCASGQFNPSMTNFSLSRSSGRNRNILPIFMSLGESLFKINSSIVSKQNKVVNNRSYQDEIIVFNSSKATRFLGDLRKSRYPQTISEKHQWLLVNQYYIWGFLEGYFDSHGGAYKENGNRIVLRSSSRNDCNFLLNLLSSVGIKEPKLQTLNRAEEGVGGVVLSVIDDARIFAQNVHSRIPDKERVLEYYRTRQSQKGLMRISEDQLVAEYEMIKKLLAHPPYAQDILELRKANNTKYSLTTYSKRFGDGSFVKAREKLEETLLKKAT